MRRQWRLTTVAGVLALTASLFSATPAEAYAPGTADALRVVYNYETGKWDFHCTFRNWRSGARVEWKCQLWEYGNGPWGGYAILVSGHNHTGSWTPPPSTKSTATYHQPVYLGQGYFCVKAFALSVDGGDSDQACG